MNWSILTYIFPAECLQGTKYLIFLIGHICLIYIISRQLYSINSDLIELHVYAGGPCKHKCASAQDPRWWH